MVKLCDLLLDKSLQGLGTDMTSFGRQFDFHDAIYHIQHCNVDNRQCNVVFTTIGRSKRSKILVSVLTRVAGNSDSLFKMVESL